MNRADLQQLATMRIAEAQALLAAGFPAGAYYLAGYAVECAIKSCIAKRVQQYDFPPDKKTVDKIYQHDLETLMRAADIWVEFESAKSSSSVLDDHWKVVKDWSESKRYDATIATMKATSLIAAIMDPTDGVLIWLMQRW